MKNASLAGRQIESHCAGGEKLFMEEKGRSRTGAESCQRSRWGGAGDLSGGGDLISFGEKCKEHLQKEGN